ncbi:NeuD/PglB/VioB family sugar acetyltransferase [Sporosarcina limicola]|uniref:Acetyltransferase EpsM n=1 Tax=Sporosarcina limicola TaxID=34101 RepID=A0A927MM02_9BACL|nr:acetyltransferase EpsM [Sporosarcina limicola]
MRKIVIIGDSGHAKVIADVVNSNDDMMVYARLDDKYQEVFVEGELLKGPVNHLFELIGSDSKIRIVIGIGSNIVRKKIVSNLKLPSEMYVSAIHCDAIVSPSAEIGNGTVVMPGAVVNADAKIGNHVIVNSGSVVEHDCVVGDYSHISPNAVLTGGVSTGEGTHIGASASIIPLKKVGTWSIVGAGAVVVSDIEDNVTVVGMPARVVKREGL